MIRPTSAEQIDFKKALVGEMMTLQRLYDTHGLEIRVDKESDLDGYRIGAKRFGEDPEWFTIAYLPGKLGLTEIQKAVEQVAAYVGDGGLKARTLIPGRML